MRAFSHLLNQPDYQAFSEFVFDVKFGVQKALNARYGDNVFISAALLGDWRNEEVIPLFRAGIQISIRK